MRGHWFIKQITEKTDTLDIKCHKALKAWFLPLPDVSCKALLPATVSCFSSCTCQVQS